MLERNGIPRFRNSVSPITLLQHENVHLSNNIRGEVFISHPRETGFMKKFLVPENMSPVSSLPVIEDCFTNICLLFIHVCRKDNRKSKF